MDLKNKRVLLTGGSGFFGRYVHAELLKKKPSQIIVPRSLNRDLRKMENCLAVTKDVDVVFHLAGHIGGIGLNLKKPAELFYDNAIMGLQIIEAAKTHQVQKVVVVGTICSYPKFTPVPFKESSLWEGYPEEINGFFGQAKKMLLVQLNAYRKQYGLNGIFLLPVNLYGPHDHFDPQSSHVIPALIEKIHSAIETGAKEIVLWGDGSSTREFLYVEDAAKALILSAEKYDGEEPINLGSGVEISIKNLAEKIGRFLNYSGRFIWDAAKPQGQLRRCLDTSKAKRYFHFQAETSLDEGLEKTIQWYLKGKDGAKREEDGLHSV